VNRRGRARRAVLIGTLTAAIALIAYVRMPAKPAASQDATASVLLPVTVASASRENVPIRLSALGSVVAFNTVTVRPRVDGQLIDVPFREGQIVKEGSLLAQIDRRPFEVQLEQAEGQRARDQAQLSQAQTELRRDQLLLDQDSIARTNVEAQAAAVKQLEGALTVDQAAIDLANLNLSFTRVTSPIAGRLGLRQIDVGNLVAAATTQLVVVTQIEPIAVVFTLPEDALRIVLPRIRARQPVHVEVFDRSGALHLASGNVVALDNLIDQATGTVRLKATFSNHDRALFPAQFVNVRITADVRRNQIVVPAAAIQQGPQGSFVYAVQDGKAVAQPVTLGSVDGERASIDRGIEAGADVVVDGADRLRNGSPVTIRSPLTTAAAAPATGVRGASPSP
jgi:membrane fusion protein, multidrug efflux system